MIYIAQKGMGLGDLNQEIHQNPTFNYKYTLYVDCYFLELLLVDKYCYFQNDINVQNFYISLEGNKEHLQITKGHTGSKATVSMEKRSM